MKRVELSMTTAEARILLGVLGSQLLDTSTRRDYTVRTIIDRHMQSICKQLNSEDESPQGRIEDEDTFPRPPMAHSPSDPIV